MVVRKKRLTISNNQQRQKNISNKLIKIINELRKNLQMEENIKYGRKGRSVSFVYASDILANKIGGNIK